MQVAELKAKLEACTNNDKNVVVKSVKIESEIELKANELNQTVQSESESKEKPMKRGKDNSSTCFEVSTDQIRDAGTP